MHVTQAALGFQIEGFQGSRHLYPAVPSRTTGGPSQAAAAPAMPGNLNSGASGCGRFGPLRAAPPAECNPS